MNIKGIHGQDARGTHGRDGRATETPHGASIGMAEEGQTERIADAPTKRQQTPRAMLPGCIGPDNLLAPI
jgi:hypothetical protein